MTISRGCRAGPLLVMAAAVSACGGGTSTGSGSLALGPRIELRSPPVATYDAPSGKTTVVLDFLVRDPTGNSVDPSTAKLRRLVDGRVADVESVPNFTDTRYAADLHLGLVLDASYSMTQWTPPAFDPMKKAAFDTVQSIQHQFQAGGAGTFTYSLEWFFDRYLCTPESPTMPLRAVLDIPSPSEGAATKSLAATSRMIDALRAQRDAAPKDGRAQNYALVLFTDGWDNYSWQDSSSAEPKVFPVTDGAFACSGAAPATLQDVVAKIGAFPELRVHVIGLGNDIKGSELRALTTAGHGRLATNPDTKQVTALFAEIAKEFTTARRDGVTMPLPPGDYEYVEEVTLTGSVATVKFRFHAGDANARVYEATVTAS